MTHVLSNLIWSSWTPFKVMQGHWKVKTACHILSVRVYYTYYISLSIVITDITVHLCARPSLYFSVTPALTMKMFSCDLLTSIYSVDFISLEGECFWCISCRDRVIMVVFSQVMFHGSLWSCMIKAIVDLYTVMLVLVTLTQFKVKGEIERKSKSCFPLGNVSCQWHAEFFAVCYLFDIRVALF